MEVENKIIEFVREFNSNMEDRNHYCNINYLNDGFTQAIYLPEIAVFDDNNDSVEFVRQRALTDLFLATSQVRDVAIEMLLEETDAFFLERKIQLKLDFPKAKMNITQGTIWNVSMSGSYDEELISDFCDKLEQDFQYIFEGLKIRVEY
jgi:hypothetical protein